MGKVTGFMEFERLAEANLPVVDRVKNYKDFGWSVSIPYVSGHYSHA